MLAYGLTPFRLPFHTCLSRDSHRSSVCNRWQKEVTDIVVCTGISCACSFLILLSCEAECAQISVKQTFDLAMLSESLLARSSRSLLSSQGTSALARQAFHGASSTAGRGGSQAQQGASRSWTLLRVTAADSRGQASPASRKQQMEPPVAPEAGGAKNALQVRAAPRPSRQKHV